MQTKPIVFLEGKRIYLRPLDLSDVKLIQKYANDPDVRHYLSNLFPASQQDEESWIKKIMERNPNEVVLAVVLKKQNKLLGCMGLHKINYVDGTASTGSMLGAKDEWNDEPWQKRWIEKLEECINLYERQYYEECWQKACA